MDKGFVHIVWFITKRCNLRCKHCYHESFVDTPETIQRQHEIDNKIVESIINLSNSWEIDSIGFLGGEALLHERLFEIVEKLRDNISCNFSLGSNGTIINDNVINKMIKYNIDGIQISLDSPRRDFHDYIRGTGNFDKSIKTIKRLIKNNINVVIRMTVCKENFNDIEDFVTLGKSLGVRSVSLNKFIDTKGQFFEGLNSIDPDMHKLFINKIYELKMKFGDSFVVTEDPCINVKYKQSIIDDFSEEFEEGFAFGGCSAGLSTIVINSNGGIQPCTLIPIEVGNIMERELTDIWEDGQDGILDKLRYRELEGKCSECNNILFCGGCRASAYHMNNNLYGEDPFCSLV